MVVDPLAGAMKIASSGLDVQSSRMRIASENLANASSTGETPGAEPYRRKTISFGEAMDQASGVSLVQVSAYGRSDAPYRVERNPSHPAADENGNVKLPNVNSLIELADMQEANRSYEANLQVVKMVREMIAIQIDLLRSER
ncbi:MAG: flagellar basal body rod protein FlgC [Hyphomicrobiaceae bacterium]